MKKVLVCSSVPLGSSLAHAINIIKMADGFARLGHEVLFVGRRDRAQPKTPAALQDLYHTHPSLKWQQVSPLFPRTYGFAFQVLPIIKKFQPDFIYARDYFTPVMGSLLGYPSIIESHAHVGCGTRPFRIVTKGSRLQNFRGWITISERLKDYYIQCGVAPEKIHVLPDAVDIELFTQAQPLPPSPYEEIQAPRVIYTGHLYDYKGIPTILETAEKLPHVHFHLVGGLPEDIARHQATITARDLKNVFLHGLKPHSDIPPYLWHGDVLLLVPSQHHASAAWTSPVKLGEYLASGTPMIASRIPALQDWLTDQETCFVAPDDADDLAKGIEKLLGDTEYGKSLVASSLKMAQDVSYTRRCQRIIDALAASG